MAPDSQGDQEGLFGAVHGVYAAVYFIDIVQEPNEGTRGKKERTGGKKRADLGQKRAGWHCTVLESSLHHYFGC